MREWSDVRGRLERLAAAPGAGEVFGSNGHEWVLEPSLTTAQLAELEAQLSVELPGDYRSFLLEVSAGVAGPGYGLFPVHAENGRWQWAGDGASLTGLDTLNQPFPHVEPFNPADGLPKQPDEDDYATEAEFNDAEDAYWEQHDAVVFRPEHAIGLVYLCHRGCALREALVVSGPARGHMWADDTADGGGFRPLLDDDGAPLGFARWYRRWLESAEEQAY